MSGLQNGDPGVPGVVVNLLNGSGMQTGTTLTTDSNGDINFTGLAPGSYEVSVDTPSGDVVTGTTNIDSPDTLTGRETASASEGVFQVPAGTYLPPGATAPMTDQPGTYSPSGATEPTQAPPGFYVPGPGAAVAIEDLPGTYTPNSGATTALAAPPGFYVPGPGASVAKADPVGTYTNTSGATAPTVIPAGFYDPTPSGTPIGAPAGTYIPATGATSPGAEIPAPAGYYDAGTGNTAPKIDPAGSYTGSPGSTAPILAPAGTYVPTPGATAPTVAPAGYYDPGTGNTAPVLLPAEVWAKGVSGSWQTAKNWNPAAVPGATTNAELTATGFYSVTSSQTTTVGAIRTASGATLDITAGTFTLLAGTGTGTNAGAVLVGINSVFATPALLAAPTSFATPAFGSGDPTLTLTGLFANAASGFLLADDGTIDMIGGSITGGNVVVGSAATLEATGGGSDTVSNTTLTNFGVVEAGAGTSLTLSGTTDNLGILEAKGGGTLTITGPLTNLGVLEANGGNVTVSANQIAGAAQIYSASKMTFLGSASVAASFQNNAGDTGELVLAKSGSFTGSVAGFFYDGTHSDTLDLGSIGFASGVTWSFAESANGKQGVLTVSDHSGDTVKLTLLGGYLAGGKSATSATSSIFQLASDGATPTAGTLVTTKVL